jgi:putative hydrolase of the HAD superfamily
MHARASGRRAQRLYMFENVQRIFFDSGMVLLHPKSGDWFYPNVYNEYCKKHSLSEKGLYQYINFRFAYDHLSSIKQILNESEEYEAFLEFYTILFHNLKGKNNIELIELCTNATVWDYKKYTFYDDVKDSIKKLNSKYEMGIISDAWPSLFNVYKQNDMFRYFEPFILSSIYGCTKAGYDLFRFALANAAQKPDECLFVDDSYDNCKRARKLGMQVIVLNRNKYHKQKNDIMHICSMKELENVLGIF